jgi:hypothetical protein
LIFTAQPFKLTLVFCRLVLLTSFLSHQVVANAGKQSNRAADV